MFIRRFILFQDNALQQKIVRKSKKDWVLNPAGKSTICILHEYLQHSVKKAPTYKYQEMDSSTTPYSAVVEINGIEYGRGAGSSKKEAKSEAARLTLEILIPEFKNNMNAKNGVVIKESVDLSVCSEMIQQHQRPFNHFCVSFYSSLTKYELKTPGFQSFVTRPVNLLHMQSYSLVCKRITVWETLALKRILPQLETGRIDLLCKSAKKS